MPANQAIQGGMLGTPVMPPPRRDAQRQAGTGAAAVGATIAAYRHWIARVRRWPLTVGLPVIVAMAPQYAEAAGRASRRTIHIAGLRDGVKMLSKRGNGRYNPMHRLVSFVLGWCRNFPR